MITVYEPTVPIAIANVFTYPVWGLIFAGTGMLGAYGLIRNQYELVRNAQLLGLLIKAIWLIALIIRSIAAPSTILIMLVWILFSAIQAGVYISFIPSEPKLEEVPEK